MTRYALVDPGMPSKELLSWRGLVIVHENKAELEFLTAFKAVECPRDIPPEQTIQIRHHPQFAAVRWPLDRKQFR